MQLYSYFYNSWEKKKNNVLFYVQIYVLEITLFFSEKLLSLDTFILLRITTNDETKFGEFPWMVAVLEGRHSIL